MAEYWVEGHEPHYAISRCRSKSVFWGNKWGNMLHRSQPIPADLSAKAHNRTVRVGTRGSTGLPL